MKTPTWAIAICICMMLFGGCSLKNSVESINMPSLLDVQQEMISEMKELSEPKNSDSSSSMDSNDVQERVDMFQGVMTGMNNMLSMSEFARTWIVRFGYIGLIISFIYLAAGAILLIKTKYSIQFVYSALTASIVFGLMKFIVLISDSSSGFLVKSIGFGNLFGIVIDLTLIIILATMDKSDYKKQLEANELTLDE